MHDNSLARAMINHGWDIQLIPTYTPIRTDEQDVTIDHVYFGGINLYLQQKIPLFRHIPAMLDRIFDNPWLIKRLTAKASETSPKLLGSLSVSMLKGLHGNQRKEVRRLVRWLQTDVKPDGLLLTNMLIAGFVPYFKQQLDIPVVTMLQGDDIFLDSLPESYREQAVNEIRKLGPHIDAFIYHSQFYADKMNEWFSFDPGKTHITPLAIDTTDFEYGGQQANQQTSSSGLPSIDPQKTCIGYLARIAPEKGLHVLVDAFIRLKQTEAGRQTHLLIAGWLGDHNRGYAEQQKNKLVAAGLDQDFDFLGTVDRPTKIAFLNQLDIFSVPTVYQDPKGIFVLEAMASGLPVIQPAHGAFPEIIQSTGGGLLFEPENDQQLAEQLATLLADPQLRRELGVTGRDNVRQHRNLTTLAADAANVLQPLLNQAS